MSTTAGDRMAIADEAPDTETDLADREAQLELLAEENRRLREAYGRVRQTRHRRTALGLFAIGSVGVVGAAVFPAVRVVLLVLSATGWFGGLLTWYLTPERFVAADVGERVYAALAANEAAVVAELGLVEPGWYLPLEGVPDREVALFIGQHIAEDEPTTLTSDGRLETAFVVASNPAKQGLALRPTGAPLLAALREGTPGGLGDDPVTLVEQVAEGLAEQFELVDGARPDVDVADGRASIAVDGSAYGAVDRFDHPVASLLGTGLAVGLAAPVRVTVDRPADGRHDFLVTAQWSADGADSVDDGAAESEPSAGSE